MQIKSKLYGHEAKEFTSICHINRARREYAKDRESSDCLSEYKKSSTNVLCNLISLTSFCQFKIIY